MPAWRLRSCLIDDTRSAARDRGCFRPTSFVSLRFSSLREITSVHQSFKLLNVAIMAVCGIVGVIFLSQGMRIVSTAGKEGATARRWVMWLWVIVYAFVGSQMAWTLRPFVGAPSMKFELFRQLGGNFYTNIFASLGEILGFFVVR
jgi:hypothetical protein